MKKIVLICWSLFVVAPVWACDSCGCSFHQPELIEGTAPAYWYAGVSEQFTSFGTLQEAGREVPNTVNQYLESSNTQLYAGYQFNDRINLQLNIPTIVRSFRRPEGFAIDQGTIGGLGDLSLTANLVAFRHVANDWSFQWTVAGGVKFPTGDPDRIKEELNEVEVEDAPESGIHGHDLALGSGSFDGLVATGFQYHWQRFFATAELQYAIRSEGEIGYRYANELDWSGGPGFELFQAKDCSVGLQLLASGNSKGKDTFQGEKEGDTALTAVYLGPEVVARYDRMDAHVGVDLPVVLNNTSFQAVPDYRIKGGFTWHF